MLAVCPLAALSGDECAQLTSAFPASLVPQLVEWDIITWNSWRASTVGRDFSEHIISLISHISRKCKDSSSFQKAGFSPSSLALEPVSLVLSMLCEQKSLGGNFRKTLLPFSAFSFFLSETDVLLRASVAIFHLWGNCEDESQALGAVKQRGQRTGSLLMSWTCLQPWKANLQTSMLFKTLLFGFSVVSNGLNPNWNTASQCGSIPGLRCWTPFSSVYTASIYMLHPCHSSEHQIHISNCLLTSPFGHI